MQIDITQILLQIVNFGILLAVLTRFMYKPILKILESRSLKIQAGLEAAEKSLEEAAKADEKRQATLLKTEKQASKVLDKARVEAKHAAREIVTTAKKEAQEAVKKEYKILEARLQKEETKARKNIASLVAETTKTVLKGALSQKEQKSIIASQIKQLNKYKK